MNSQKFACEKTMKCLVLRLLILLILTLVARPGMADCAPPLTGAPCAQGGLASMATTEPTLNLGAGNPVNIATGNKYQHDVDLPANRHAPGLELIRHYNAFNTSPSAYGTGWTLSYDTRLYRVGHRWQIVQADGRRVTFPDTDRGPGGTHQNRHGRLDHVDGHHNWFWPNGTILRFNHQGFLVSLRWPNGESVYLQRNTSDGPRHGTLEQVSNDRGQTLTFHYRVDAGRARLDSVQTPAGHFHYQHDKHDRLIHVQRPDAMRRYYLYESQWQSGHKHALTGIEISTSQGQRERLNSWIYDASGRVITATGGEPDSTRHLITLDYQRAPSKTQPGLTLIHNATQQATQFHIGRRNDRYVLIGVEGAGCPGCAAPGTQARYDSSGRLTFINGTQLERNHQGVIHTLRPAHAGWPDLVLGYNPQGRRDYWHTTATGLERMQFNSQGLPVRRLFANGDSMDITYDLQHRPVRITEQHQQKTATTQLVWRGNWLTGIQHPNESETREHDAHGRITSRDITRTAAAHKRIIRYREHFAYDTRHRLTQHMLPEGGSLRYEWGRDAQLRTIYWHDPQGERHTILSTQSAKAGYRYGNGLHLDTAADSHHQIRRLRVRDGTNTLLSQHLSYDSEQRLDTEVVHQPTSTDARAYTANRYAYDASNRLIGVRNAGTTWLAWQADGRAAAQHREGMTHKPTIQADASGLARHAHDYQLEYGANRRLISVSHNDQPLAHYQHNAFGYQIARTRSNGDHTDLYYLNNQLVAESARASTGKTPRHTAGGPAITRRYVYAHHVPVAIIDYTDDMPHGQLYAVHADLQGAPRMVTDQSKRIRWQASYTPLGHAINIRGDLHLDLRLPGQVHDPDTGWHDNLLRTYLPTWGHYLEPDPLGPVPGNQAYGYAAQQPRRYSDPTGLLLFAFDGTRHSSDTQSNVWKMSQYYLDGPVHYHSGPGNTMYIDWDALTAHQAQQIIDTQWKWLLLELSRSDPADTTPIDILGFSRGAALARHFGNLIQQHVDQGLFQFNDSFYGSVSACVDLRFMGLFDTVAQFGVGGSQNHQYDLNIAQAWDWVAHAVALHEHRWLFPLLSAADTDSDNVVEAPFIGAHSDIGGGVMPDQTGLAGSRGDLSDVTLNWMIWQARAASVRFDNLADADQVVTDPIVHDARSSVLRQIQNGDRSIQSSSGRAWLNYQDDHPHLGRDRRTQTEPLIQRATNWRKEAGIEVGQVDMDGYARWLHDELGWEAAPV